MWIALDGGIGCGKTTVLRRMAASGVRVLEEPVGDPSTGAAGAWDELLAAMYEGGPEAALALQLRVAQDRALHPDVVATGTAAGSFALIERSPDVQRRTFAKMRGFDEVQTAQVEAVYDQAALLWRPAGIIYLRVQPAVTYARACARGRECEAMVSLDYHTRLHDLHEEAVEALRAEGRVPVVVIDGSDGDAKAVCSAVEKAYAQLSSNVV